MVGNIHHIVGAVGSWENLKAAHQETKRMLMKSISIGVDCIYVPLQLRRSIDGEKVQRLAEQILNEGQKTPIQVRREVNRYVLVTGVHRLEAMRALGETVIEALIVRARLR